VTPGKAVLDANVFVRSAVQRSTAAREWLDAVEADELDAHVPELVFAEVGSSLLKYVRAGTMSAADAVTALETVVALPLRTHRLGVLAPGALALAVETGLSVYDCCYAVLAESIDGRLVTADRRLAAAVGQAELLT
jgi:predicted nucleic acid-binding protein